MPFIQDISKKKNINPIYAIGEDDLIIANPVLCEFKTEIDSLELTDNINYIAISYDHLSGDALRIGEAINIVYFCI